MEAKSEREPEDLLRKLVCACPNAKFGEHLTKHELSASDLPDAFRFCRERFGDAWLAQILLKTYGAEHDYEAVLYGNLKPVVIPASEGDPGSRHLPYGHGRPAPMAKILGIHILASPSFRNDLWAMSEMHNSLVDGPMSRIPDAPRERYKKKLKADARAVGTALVFARAGRPKKNSKAVTPEPQEVAKLRRMRSDDQRQAYLEEQCGEWHGLKRFGPTASVAISLRCALVREEPEAKKNLKDAVERNRKRPSKTI